ncbi:MAG: hypothetical protein JWM64_1651 [Frankiales bacterium]|nr:hypothetical protein [Frankiales bacterium]
MRLPRYLVVVLALLAPLLLVPPASATHPCVQTPDGSAYDPFETASHDGCDYYLGYPAALLGEATDGQTVEVPRGRTALVSLAAAPAGQVWSEVRAEDAATLYRLREVVDARTGYALFQARREGTAVVTATTSCLLAAGCSTPVRRWSATVRVTPGELPAVSPRCRRQPVGDAPETTVVTEAQDGATVTVVVGRRLRVALSRCSAGGGLVPPVAADLLERDAASSQQPGAASAVFLARRTGRTTVTAGSDAPCTSDPAPCTPGPGFSLTVDIVPAPACAQPDAVGLSASPAQVAPGDLVTLDVAYRQPCGQPQEHALRVTALQTDLQRELGTLTTRAASVDTASTTDTPTVTTEYRAGGATARVEVAGYVGSCAGAVALTGPATARPGATVPLQGRAAPGERVEVLFRRTGTGTPFVPGWVVRRTLTAGADGSFRTSYAAAGDEDVYASAGRCSSRPTTVRVLPTVSGPATVRRGTTVSLTVRGPAAAPVRVLFHAAGTSGYTVRRTGTLDARGTLRVTYRADVDQRWYAVVGGGATARTSPAGLTRTTR